MRENPPCPPRGGSTVDAVCVMPGRRYTWRLLAVAVTAAIVLPTTASADTGCPTAAPYSGAGTIASPFVIATPGNLQAWRDTSAHWDDVVELAGDIDMGGCTWTTTIGQGTPFGGSLDGAGHVISGLDVSVTGIAAGLVAIMDPGATVSNLGFDGDVTGQRVDNQTGASANATVVAGGLVGGLRTGATIVRSFAAGTVSASTTAYSDDFFGDAISASKVGGLVGDASGTISDSYAIADLSAAAAASLDGQSMGTASVLTMLGGIAGHVQGGSITNSYSAIGTLSASQTASAPGGSTLTNAWRGRVAAQLQNSPSVNGVVWESGPWLDGAHVGGPAGTGVPPAALSDISTFGPSGQGWSIADGYSASTAWSMCANLNSGRPVLTVFLRGGCIPVPGPDPDPQPDPAPAPVPSPAPSAPSAVGGSGTQGQTDTPAAVLTVIPRAHGGSTVPVGRRSVLVDGVRTSGTVTGVGAWCEVRGVRLPRPLQARMCGIRVDRGAASTVRSNATRAIRVTARPTCSTGLVIRVRISARAAGATRTTWARSWRVSSSPPVPCRIAPKYAVTG